MRIGSIWLSVRSNDEAAYGNESSVFMKEGGFLDYLSEYQLP
jgi:hypothetical protein